MDPDEPGCSGTFAEPAAVDAAVLDLLASRPHRGWRAAAVVERLDYSVLDIMMSLARLARAGTINRTDPGRYRSGNPVPPDPR